MTPIFRPAYKQGGFTLLEVMIAIAILALMSLAISEVTVRSSRVTFKLGGESTEYVATALSLQAVEADLSQIYSPVIPVPKPGVAPETSAKEPGDFWSEPVRPDGIRRSRLLGTKEKISFITNGNRRVEADSPQSDFLRVTWEIERNPSGAYTLYRSADWDVFEYERVSATSRRAPPRVALMENLSSAKFTYYRRENKTWEDQWDSEGRFVKPEGRYPDLISLKVEAPDPTNAASQQTWEVVIKPNIELNVPTPPNGTIVGSPGE